MSEDRKEAMTHLLHTLLYGVRDISLKRELALELIEAIVLFGVSED